MLRDIFIKIYLILYKIKYKVIKNCKFESGSLISRTSKFEGNNIIYKNSKVIKSYMGYASYMGENGELIRAKIGKYTCIGPDVKCIIGTHPTDRFVSIHPAFYSLRKQCGFTYVKEQKFEEIKNEEYSIKIGNDVWIGAGVRILEGVNIGDGAIIAAGAIVTKDVEAYSIVGGIPAKVIKWRFDKEKINFLKEIKWWEKDEIWIKENIDEFTDIELFYNKFSEMRD